MRTFNNPTSVLTALIPVAGSLITGSMNKSKSSGSSRSAESSQKDEAEAARKAALAARQGEAQRSGRNDAIGDLSLFADGAPAGAKRKLLGTG